MIKSVKLASVVHSMGYTKSFSFDDMTKEFNWYGETDHPSPEDILNAYDALEYQEERKKEYPSIEDQLDSIYHDGVDAWKAEIKAVKDKYPKPE